MIKLIKNELSLITGALCECTCHASWEQHVLPKQWHLIEYQSNAKKCSQACKEGGFPWSDCISKPEDAKNTNKGIKQMLADVSSEDFSTDFSLTIILDSLKK